MTSRLRFLTFCLILFASGFPRLALTEEASDAALEVFNKGVALFNSGKFQAAADTFREAYTLRPSWKLLFNIGQSEAAAKRYGLALESFEQFLAEGGDEITEDRRDEVLAEVVRLRKMVGYLKVEAAEGTVIFVDDLKRGTAPSNTLLPIAAGINHMVRGEMNGEVVFSESYKVVGGQTMDVDMNAEKSRVEETEVSPVEDTALPAETEVIEAAEAGPSEPTAKHPLIVAGWAVAGVGAATAVAGAVVGGIALSKNNALADQCKDTGCPDKTSDEEKYTSMGNASTALLAAGGTVLATGITLLVVGMVKKYRETPPVAAAVFANKSGAAASLAISF